VNEMWTFLLIWGVWLVAPVLVDGTDTVYRLIVVWSRRRQARRRAEVGDDELPTMSIIVPAHNEA
jgi:cellulose synthase/poly-beta-1,6-N-acetylglucosamine synthase-like glycosyltransferase